MRCLVEEKFKRLEETRKNAMEVEKEEDQETEESKKSQQDLISGSFHLLAGRTPFNIFFIIFVHISIQLIHMFSPLDIPRDCAIE